jgi:hypothetical protein
MSQITPDHVEKLLQHWGALYGMFDPRFDIDEGEPPLLLTSQLGTYAVDRTREGDAQVLMPATKRAVIARKLIQRMGKESGSEGRVPPWAGGDPIRGRESRSFRTTPWYPDPIAEQIDGWVRDLGRLDPRGAMCLRAEYQRPKWSTRCKAEWVAEATGLRVSRHGYLAGVARGRAFIRRTVDAQVKKAS